MTTVHTHYEIENSPKITVCVLYVKRVTREFYTLI